MPDPMDPLIPLDAVRVGDVGIVPDATRPVAALVAADATVSWATWPDAPMPDRAIGEARLWPTSTGVWLVYTAEDDDDPELCRQSSAVFITVQGVAAACDLGVGQLVGVDDGGLWVGSRSASRPVLEDDDEESWEADLERQRHAVDVWRDRLEPKGVDGIEWSLAPVTEEACSSAINRIRARFKGLGDPYLFVDERRSRGASLTERLPGRGGHRIV